MIDPLEPASLLAAREKVGLSRSQLAAKTNINATTILRIEKGEVDPRLNSTWAPLVRAIQETQRERAA